MTVSDAYGNSDALVSVAWVAAHLDDPKVPLLEVEVDVDTTAYETRPYPRSAGINWTTQLGHPIRRVIPSQAGFEELMRQCGMANSTHLVLIATTTTGSPRSPTGSPGYTATPTCR